MWITNARNIQGVFSGKGGGQAVQQFPIPEVDIPLSDPGISKVHNYYCVVWVWPIDTSNFSIPL